MELLGSRCAGHCNNKDAIVLLIDRRGSDAATARLEGGHWHELYTPETPIERSNTNGVLHL